MARLVEITDIRDDLLLPWLDLYETSFPPAEKMLVSEILGVLKEKERGAAGEHHLLAALGDDDKLAGIVWYHLMPECSAAVLWYLAVRPEGRNRGVGAGIYQEIAGRAKADGVKALVLEVEIPEEAETPEQADLAQRRIGFYRRQGAKLLRGIHYLQSVGPHQPSIRMHIVVQPFVPMTAEEAFGMARCIFIGSPVQVGPLGLE